MLSLWVDLRSDWLIDPIICEEETAEKFYRNSHFSRKMTGEESQGDCRDRQDRRHRSFGSRLVR